MLIKAKVNARILDMIKYGTQDETLMKMKNTTIMVDINPNNLM